MPTTPPAAQPPTGSPQGYAPVPPRPYGNPPPYHGPGYPPPGYAPIPAGPPLHPYDDPCRTSRGCWEKGKCTSFAGRCIAYSNVDCVPSQVCRDIGACSAVEGLCQPASDADCRSSALCSEHGRCYYDTKGRHCDEGTDRRSTGALVGGIVAMGTGGAAFLFGLVLLPFTGDGFIGNPELRPVSVGLMVAGGAIVAVGIPLTVWGGGREKRPEATLTLGPGQADFALRF